MALIVGFALFGAVTFLPLFFQTVNGAGATESGLRLIPMMAGLLITSIVSGQVISRVGRYRAFPIVGTAVMVLGFLLLSTMGTGTSALHAGLDLLVLGLGMGCTMQVLVLAVQNAVDYTDLGVATSGATLFRSIGGALGTAVFGAIFAHELSVSLAAAGTGPGGAALAGTGGHLSPAQLHALPARLHDAYLGSFTDALSTVFVVAAVVAGLGFLLALLLPERPLRATAGASSVGDGLASPRAPDSLAEIERALGVLARRDARKRMYERLAERAGLDLPPAAVWSLVRISDGEDPVRLAQIHGVPADRVAAGLERLETDGLVVENGARSLTPAGEAVLERLVKARRERLCEHLEGWSPEQHEELARVLTRLARDLVGDGRAA
jgi:DNA-binding MarR family transcriptional regulator